MTDTTRTLIEELRALPEKEQEAAAASLLHRLREQREAQEQREPDGNGESLYESFRVLRDAKLQLAPDASATYEQELYGREGRSDEEA